MLEPGEKLFSVRDLRQAATLLMMTPVALIVPLSRWPQSCSIIARLSATFKIQGLLRHAVVLTAFKRPEDLAAESKNAYLRCLEMYWESRLQIVDQNLIKRWRPQIGISGRDHLDAALDTGHGAILWVTPFAFSDLVTKMGLAQAGYNIAHLSRREHGFSRTRFGMATLNRMRTRIEDRYLNERVMIEKHKEQRATLALRRVLKKHGIVSITVSAQTRNPDRVALRHDELKVATGAIRLARLTGAPLIPTFGVKRSDLDFHVYLEPPLDVTGPDDHGALGQYAQRLQQYLDKYPYQWRGTADFTGAARP